MDTAVVLEGSADPVVGAWAEALHREAFVVLEADRVRDLLPGERLPAFQALWEDLVLDDAVFDGGMYRYRRYGRVQATVNEAGECRVSPSAHAPFTQGVEYMPDYGGRERLFSPIEPAVLADPLLAALIAMDLAVLAGGAPSRWEIGLHMVRIVATVGTPGQPTPEGRHRDGHDFIGMHLFRRSDCTGGESIIYRGGRDPVRLTLSTPLDSLVVVDHRLMHEVTPIAAVDTDGVRDMLLIDFNAR